MHLPEQPGGIRARPAWPSGLGYKSNDIHTGWFRRHCVSACLSTRPRFRPSTDERHRTL